MGEPLYVVIDRAQSLSIVLRAEPFTVFIRVWGFFDSTNQEYRESQIAGTTNTSPPPAINCSGVSYVNFGAYEISSAPPNTTSGFTPGSCPLGISYSGGVLTSTDLGSVISDEANRKPVPDEGPGFYKGFAGDKIFWYQPATPENLTTPNVTVTGWGTQLLSLRCYKIWVDRVRGHQVPVRAKFDIVQWSVVDGTEVDREEATLFLPSTEHGLHEYAEEVSDWLWMVPTGLHNVTLENFRYFIPDLEAP